MKGGKMTIQAIQATTPNLTSTPKKAVKTGTVLSAVHFGTKSLLSHVKIKGMKQDKDVFELNQNNNPEEVEEELAENPEEQENAGILETMQNGVGFLNKIFGNVQNKQ